MELKRKEISILLFIGYFAPLFFSVVSTFWIGVSVFCGLLLFKEQRTAFSECTFSSGKISIKNITVLIFLMALAFGLRLLFSLEFIDSGLEIGGIIIIPTFTLLVYPIIGVFFEGRNRKKLKFKYFPVFFATIGSFVLVYFKYDFHGIGVKETIEEIWNCIFIAATCEELFFRSAVYNTAAKLMGKKRACFFSATVFTLWHFNLVEPLLYNFSPILFMNLISVFSLGIITVVIYEKCGIIYSIIFHTINNGVILYILALIWRV